MQLELFENNTEVELLKKEIRDIRDRSENVRRGLFARHNELAKLYMEQKEEIDQLKRFINAEKAKDVPNMELLRVC
jgi:hypothetical protein